MPARKVRQDQLAQSGGLMRYRHIYMALSAAASVVALLLFGAAPASAYPIWQSYKSNSNWHCSDTFPTSLSQNVVFQTCIIVNASDQAQAVLVVANRGTKDASISGGPFSDELYGEGGSYYCEWTTLDAGEAIACFGKTVALRGCGHYYAQGRLWANQVGLEVSGLAKYTKWC